MHESAGTERQQQRIKVRKGKRCGNKEEHRGDKHTQRAGKTSEEQEHSTRDFSGDGQKYYWNIMRMQCGSVLISLIVFLTRGQLLPG